MYVVMTVYEFVEQELSVTSVQLQAICNTVRLAAFRKSTMYTRSCTQHVAMHDCRKLVGEQLLKLRSGNWSRGKTITRRLTHIE